MKRTLLLLPLILMAASCIRPVDLSCEYVKDPVAVDAFQPRLSWINEAVPSFHKGEFQTAYRIRVASTRDGLRHPDMWDTGKVISDRSTLIKYNGNALQSTQDCWWQVQVWDARGHRSAWSKPAFWGVGIMGRSEWQADWIGFPGAECPLLRKSFKVGGNLASAKVYVTGLGLYQLFVNGDKVGEDELTPNESNWEYLDDCGKAGIPVDRSKFRTFRVIYNGYDITSMLHEGDNAIGAMLGNGFYKTNERWVQTEGTPKFICQLYLKYKDGTVETVCSDGTWTGHAGPIGVNGLFEGETYDARKEIPGWCTADADTSDWKPVVVREGYEGEMSAHYHVSDRVMNTLKPVSIARDEDGWTVDFGDYITGWVRLRGMTGNAGDTVRVTYLCESKGNGPEVYVMKGDVNEEYAPRFTWFAFDKVKVKGFPGELTSGNIVAEEVYSNMATTGQFACSNELFNRINHIWWRSQTDNLHLGTASDCPHREKGPYTGDGEGTCVTVMHNFDAAAFYTKWLRDMSDCQNKETGYVPNGAPWHIGCGGGPGWGAAMNIIPWEFYLQYGDRDILERYFPQMTEQLRFMQSCVTPDGTMLQLLPSADAPRYWMNLGEWMPPFGFPSDELVHTYLWWKCADFTARAAQALGREEDAVTYRNLADRIADAFHSRFYDEETGSYGDNGSNLFALSMGLSGERYERVVNALISEIMSHDGHLDTGIFGTGLLFDILTDNGLGELAYGCMDKRDFPGFGWWVEQGAYTTWEQWDGELSRNHPMFGSGLSWFYRKVAGMMTDESAPGYRHIIFKPMPCGDLEWARYSKLTPYGKAGIRWDRGSEGDFRVEIVVPVGCTATLVLPDGRSKEFSSGRHKVRTRVNQSR